jgi:hypothetical protein
MTMVKMSPNTLVERGEGERPEKVRDRRIKDSEDFLKKDSSFWDVADQMKYHGPGPERNKILDEF